MAPNNDKPKTNPDTPGGDSPDAGSSKAAPKDQEAPQAQNPLAGKVKLPPAGGYIYHDLNQDMAAIANNRPPFRRDFQHANETEFQFKLFKHKEYLERNHHWTAVTKDIHGDWFEPEAFDPDTGFIVRGTLNSGKPESIYMVRAKGAKDAEIKAQKQAQEARRGGLYGKSMADLEELARQQNKGHNKPQVEVVETPAAGRRGSWQDLMGTPPGQPK